MTIGFCCQACSFYFDWNTEEPIDPDTAEIKTIANRFCVDCIDDECDAHGLPREAVIRMRKTMGRRVP